MLRQKADLTLEELADRAGMTAARVSRVERGEQSPTVRTLERLAEALRVDLVAFFWSGPAIGRAGDGDVPERVRELVAQLVGRSDEDLLRVKILLHALFADADRLRDPDAQGADPVGAAEGSDEPAEDR